MRVKSKNALQKQKKVFVALIAGVVVLVIGISYLMLNDRNYIPSTPLKSQIDLPADKINPQEIWMNRVESQNTMLDQKIKYLEEIVLQTKQQEEETEKEKRDLKQELLHLRRELQDISKSSFQESFTTDPYFAAASHEILPSFAPLIELSMEESMEGLSTVEKRIPSGTTVKALLISSIDADCGTYSSTDPIPVKLRLLDDGHLPKRVDVDLKGGIIIASAFGNLSNERVYMRLERLTQVNADGKFIETEVAGYVSGEDGKYGIRGTVVDKSEKIVKNAAISGLFGEIGQLLHSAVGHYKIDNYLSAGQSANNPFSSNSLNTTSNAFDMLSDYYIKRAEQVKPVIQINAGRIVDITFTHGAEIGDLHMQNQLHSLREKTRNNS